MAELIWNLLALIGAAVVAIAAAMGIWVLWTQLDAWDSKPKPAKGEEDER